MTDFCPECPHCRERLLPAEYRPGGSLDLASQVCAACGAVPAEAVFRGVQPPVPVCRTCFALRPSADVLRDVLRRKVEST